LPVTLPNNYGMHCVKFK